MTGVRAVLSGFLAGAFFGFLVASATVLGASENPHSWMLGRRARVRKYEASEWELCDIVAVSWRGSVCARRVADPDGKGFWVVRSKVPTHVRFR